MTVDGEKLIDQILNWRNLELAWECVLANRAAPGCDRVTLERWGRNWQANLARLAEQVRTNTYVPNRPKRFTVAKKGGGERELSILTITDKVLQRAVLNVIDDLFERRFLDCSHGYRQGRSTATALQQVLEYRDQGYLHVLDADIAACFDSLDHAILLALIRQVISDWFVLNLAELWLKAGCKHRHQAVGVPMGAVLSPLWCNIYLHELDVPLSVAGGRVVRYADDFVVMARSAENANLAWQQAGAILQELKLELSTSKTRLTTFEQGFTFLGVAFQGRSYRYTCRDKHVHVGSQAGRRLQHPPEFY